MSGALSLDNEFMEYWLQLSQGQKATLLSVAKEYVQLQEDTEEEDPTFLEQYNKDLDEALEQMKRGESYTHEQVVAISQTWLRGK